MQFSETSIAKRSAVLFSETTIAKNITFSGSEIQRIQKMIVSLIWQWSFNIHKSNR